MNLAQSFLAFALYMDFSKPFGPASSMLSYLRPLEWKIDLDGKVSISKIYSFNCLRNSAKYIRRQINLNWNDFAIGQCIHRWDIQE